VPLCRLHHRELHQRGDEFSWWDSSISIRWKRRNGFGEQLIAVQKLST
jgi:hypothetical protein